MREELGECPCGQSRRSNRVGMRRCAEREGHRQLVGTDGLRVVSVIPTAELLAQAVVDDLPELLQSVKNLPGRVSALATQRDACAVARTGGLRR